MRQVTDGVHVMEAPQRFYGLEVGARMTVLDTGDGLLVHSPIDVDPAVVEPIGTARWVLCPNKLHHLYAGRWIEAGVPAWAAPGLPAKRPDLHFAGTLSTEEHPFGEGVAILPMRCFSMTEEVVVLHRPSRTLLVTDLVFHFTREAPWLTRAAMTAAWGYPGCSMTLLERVGFDRAIAREEVARLMAWDFDRLIMAHGAIIETGGKAALERATAWLR